MGMNYGQQIQRLRDEICANVRTSELIEYFNLNAGHIRDGSPVVFQYKLYQSAMGIAYGRIVNPLEELLNRQYAGVIQIKCDVKPEDSEIHVVQINLESKVAEEQMRFKHDVLDIINNHLKRYIATRGGRKKLA